MLDFLLGIVGFFVDLLCIFDWGDSKRKKDEVPPKDDRPHYPDLEPRQ